MTEKKDMTDATTRMGFVFDEAYLRHVPRPGHPETPQRLQAILARLEADGLLARLERIPAEPAKMEWLRAVHGAAYIAQARRDVEDGQSELSTGDTDICPDSFEAALLAAGGAAAAVRAAVEGRVRNAFCAVRPPGHHAEPDAGMGFCIFNNAAVAARYAQAHCGVEKVLIVDWDIHHGNGTQAAFYEDGSVFYFSTHLDGLYPMPLTGMGHASETGAGAGCGTNLNAPLPAGSGDAELIAAFRQKLAPAAKAFGADLAIVSAGFDSRVGDPLGSFEATDAGFAELTRIVMSLVPAGRVVSVLEGGYDCVGLASGVAAHVRALLGE